MDSSGNLIGTGDGTAFGIGDRAKDRVQAQKKAKEEREAKKKADKLARFEALEATVRPKAEELVGFVPENTAVASAASSTNISPPALNADGGASIGDMGAGGSTSTIPSLGVDASKSDTPSMGPRTSFPTASLAASMEVSKNQNPWPTTPPTSTLPLSVSNPSTTTPSSVTYQPSSPTNDKKPKSPSISGEPIIVVKKRRHSAGETIDSPETSNATPPHLAASTGADQQASHLPTSSLTPTISNTTNTYTSSAIPTSPMPLSSGLPAPKHSGEESVVASPTLSTTVPSAPPSGSLHGPISPINNGAVAAASPAFTMAPKSLLQGTYQPGNNGISATPSWMTAKSPIPTKGGSQSSNYTSKNSFVPSSPFATAASNPTLPSLGPSRYIEHNSFVPSPLYRTTNVPIPINHCALVSQASRAVAATPSPFLAATSPSTSTNGGFNASTRAAPIVSPFSMHNKPVEDLFAGYQSQNLITEDMDGVLTEHRPLTTLPPDSMEGLEQASDDEDMDDLADLPSSTIFEAVDHYMVEAMQASNDEYMDEEMYGFEPDSDTAMPSSFVDDGLHAYTSEDMIGVTSSHQLHSTISTPVADGSQDLEDEFMNDAIEPLYPSPAMSSPTDSLYASNHSSNDSAIDTMPSIMVFQPCLEVPPPQGALDSSSLDENMAALELNTSPALYDAQQLLPVTVHQESASPSPSAIADNLPALTIPTPISSLPTEEKVNPSVSTENLPALEIPSVPKVVEQMLSVAASPTMAPAPASMTARKIPVRVASISTPEGDKKITKSKIPIEVDEPLAAATAVVSVGMADKKMGEVAGNVEEIGHNTSIPQSLEVAQMSESSALSALPEVTPSQEVIRRTEPEKEDVAVPEDSIESNPILESAPVGLTSVADIEESSAELRKQLDAALSQNKKLSEDKRKLEEDIIKLKGDHGKQLAEAKKEGDAFRSQIATAQDDILHVVNGIVDADEWIPEAVDHIKRFKSQRDARPFHSDVINIKVKTEDKMKKRISDLKARHAEEVKEEAEKVRLAKKEVEDQHARELEDAKKEVRGEMEAEISHLKSLYAEELEDAEGNLRLAVQQIEEQALELKQMEAKTNKNPPLMVDGSTETTDDLRPVTKNRGADRQGLELSSPKMTMQGVETDRSGLGMSSRIIGHEVGSTASLPVVQKPTYLPTILEEDESDPNISPAFDLATMGESRSPLEVLATLTTCIPSAEQIKESFDAQKFTSAELSELADSADLMGSVLKAISQDCNDKKNAETSPEPDVLSTGTGEQQEELTPECTTAAPKSRKRSPFFTCKNLINLFYIVVALFTVFSYLSTFSFPVKLTTTSDTSIIDFMELPQPIYNAPTSMVWENGASELNDMISCFPGEEPVVVEPPPIRCEKPIVRHHDPGYILFQWMKAAWRCGCAKRGLVGTFCSAPRRS
ncbi:hypothetical protein VTL71DRAFT_3745 [Oculimacula yallundae]|uniref:Uncharacterized protein n=1 Tax=Oculimacula yallundae TaxID=86028 RepID=A0ABR4C3Y6_9HELO